MLIYTVRNTANGLYQKFEIPKRNVMKRLYCFFARSLRFLPAYFVIILSSQQLSTANTLQDIQITGTVSDTLNIALPGVSVSVKGTNLSTTTDMNGKFILEVERRETIIVFSMVGFETQEVSVRGDKKLEIMLKPSTTVLDESVVVAFGTQKKESLVSSITTINPSELRTASGNLTNSLAGRLAGIISYQPSGEPGNDNSQFFIRGVSTFGYKRDPLILVDGIETSPTELARLRTDDIKGFSILKDATSTSLYGARGANGVIQITTKEGTEGPAKVFLRYERSASTNTKNIEIADPVTYMRLGNEAVLTRNTLAPLLYSRSKIENTAAGTNPYIYPATDWGKELISDFAYNQRIDFNVKGGGRVARYYISGAYNYDTGNLKNNGSNNFNNNISLKSYFLRSNVNINITKTTKATVRLSGSFDDYTGPITGGNEMYNIIMHANPVMFPAYYPADVLPDSRHILFGNALSPSEVEGAGYVNPYAEMVRGYKEYAKSNLNTQFGVEQDLSFFTKGLSARAMFNISRYAFFDAVRSYNPYFYHITGFDRPANDYTIGLLNATDNPTEYLDYIKGVPDLNSSNYIEAALIYDNEFNEIHSVSGLLIATRQQRLYANQPTLQTSLPYRNEGVSGRFTYGYDTRYLLELNFGYNGSERFHEKNRYGFFPAAGIGWVVSNEKLWEPLRPAISTLKLRATYGLVGNDAIGSADDRFFYLSEVNMDDDSKGYTFGQDFNYSRDGITVNRYPNDRISWEIAKKFNVGADISLFRSLDIIVDYFTETRNNILMDRAYIPTLMGLSADVRANVGRARSSGLDFSADYNKNFLNGWWLKVRGNFTYARNEFLEYEEPEYPENFQSRVGRPINQQWGLVAQRLFIDNYEVENSPLQTFGNYAAGDIKFYDVNNDGQVTALDQVPIGYPTVPEIVYGGGFSVGYKNFDFSTFFQGASRSSFWIDPAATAPFIGQNQLLKAYAQSYWSEGNKDLYALMPRLSTDIIENNVQNSTWFMRNGAFLRCKAIEIGYHLTDAKAKKLGLSSLRFYVSANNPFLLSSFKLWDVEMGGNGLGYPIQKIYNVGISMDF